MVPAVGTKVWVERRKWPDAPHYGVQGYVLGEDEHGVWAGARPGSQAVKGVLLRYRGRHECVWLLPRDGWFMVHFLVGHPTLDIYIDIATPPTWNRRGARLVDLDFDIVVWNDGRGIQLVDEDEFEQHMVELAYPARLIDGARRASAEVLAAAQAGDAPFTMSVAKPWFDQLREIVPPTSAPG